MFEDFNDSQLVGPSIANTMLTRISHFRLLHRDGQRLFSFAVASSQAAIVAAAVSAAVSTSAAANANRSRRRSTAIIRILT